MPPQGTALELLPHMVNELLIVSSLWGVLSSGEEKNVTTLSVKADSPLGMIIYGR